MQTRFERRPADVKALAQLRSPSVESPDACNRLLYYNMIYYSI